MVDHVGPSPHSTTPFFQAFPGHWKASVVLQPQPPPEQPSALLSPHSSLLLTLLQPHWPSQCYSEDTSALLPKAFVLAVPFASDALSGPHRAGYSSSFRYHSDIWLLPPS